MNEHSSGTRAEVPPSLSDSGTPRFEAMRKNWPASYGPPEGPLWEKLGEAIELCQTLERELIVATAAPDQGSVRNATDELDAKRYRWLKSEDRKQYPKATISWRNLGFLPCKLSDEDNLDELIDAAIRALPDQKD